MIYKILTDFTDCLAEIIETLNKDFDVMFFNNVLYVGKKDPYINIDIDKVLNKNNICIIEITEVNLKSEPLPVIEWCRNKFVELDTIKFETEQQKTLKEILDFIERFEYNIQEAIKERGEENEQ